MALLEETGGARVGIKNASWPFARLTVSRRELRLRVQLMGRYSFAPEDIESLVTINTIPLIGKGIQINHHREDYPQRLIFWTLGNPEDIMKRIRRTGFID